MYASTSPNIAGTYEGKMNGRYVWSDNQQLLLYGDVMAMFNKTFDKFSINGAIGASINVSTVNSLMIDSKTACRDLFKGGHNARDRFQKNDPIGICNRPVGLGRSNLYGHYCP